MKKTFTILIAAIAAILMMAQPMKVMGQTRDKITSYANIVSGTSYYIGATAGTTDYYLYVDGSNTGNSKSGTAVPSMANATPFIFTGSNTSWTIQFDDNNGYYISLPKSNGKVNVVQNAETFTASNVNSLIQFSNNGYSIQKNSSGTQFGAYSSNQTKVWLIEVPSGYTVAYDCNGGTTGCPEDATNIASGTIITLADAPSRLFFTFAGWNDGSQTYEAGDSYTVTDNVTMTAQWTLNEGELVTLTESNLGLTGSYSSGASVTIGDITYVHTDLMKNNGKIQAKASSGTIKNNTAYSGNILGVIITHDGTANSTIIWGSDNGDDWTSIETGSGSITADFSELQDKYQYFKITRGSGAAYWTKIEVIYAPSTDPIIVASDPEEALAYNAAGGEFGYSITNPTSATLSAVSNADWITNVAVDGTNSKVTFSTSTNTGAQRQGTITLSYTGATNKVITITQNAAPIPSITAEDVDIAYNATSGEITYALNNPVANGNLSVSEEVAWISNATLNTTENKVTFTSETSEGVVARTGTVTLTYTYNTNQTVTKEVTVTQGVDATLGTSANPYTVAQARTFIDGLNGATSADGKHVSGIISQVDSYSSQYNSITYWISDDGTTTDQLQVYSGKGINGADFSSINDLKTSDRVVVKGKLKYHNNTTYEFDYNNQLVSLDRDASITVANTNIEVNAIAGQSTINVTYNNFGTETILADVTYYEADGETVVNNPETVYPWFVAEIDDDDNIECTFEENTENTARTAYFKVWAYYNDDMNDNEIVYSDLITFTQRTPAQTQYPITKTETLAGTISVTDANNVALTEALPQTVVYLTFEAADCQTFNSWTVSNTSTNPATSVTVTDGHFTMPAGAVTVTANTTASPVLEYLYVVNGVNGEDLSTCTSPLTLPTTVVTPRGFRFVGWTTDEDDVDNIITSYSFDANETVLFYAVFAHLEGGVYTYQRITSNNSLSDGNYLIVYENENGSKIHDGGLYDLNASSNYIDVAIGEGNVINGTSAINNATFTITAYGQTDDTYSIRSTSGKYMGKSADSNGMDQDVTMSSSLVNTISFSENDCNIVGAGGTHLRYNSSATTFRYYKSSTYTNQKAIQLYKQTVIEAGTTAYYTRVIDTNPTENIEITTTTIIAGGSTLDMGEHLITNDDPTKLIIEDGAQLILANGNDNVKATVKKSITAAVVPNSKVGEAPFGWYSISSSVNNAKIAGDDANTNLITASGYDLYRYNETVNAQQWENYHANNDFTHMTNGRGYLYRNAEDIIVEFKGTVNTGDITYHVTYTAGSGDLAGFNLIGNPYTHDIYKGDGTAIDSDNLSEGFYVATNSGSWLPCTDNDTKIEKNQGILVQASESFDLTMTNTDAKTSSSKANHDNIKFMVANSQYEDVAYAMFDKGNGLNKISHRNAEIPMLYIPQNDENYAIAMMSDNTQSFGLNFKAMTMGKYTLSYKADGQFSYLHVIDRLTGEDVDMLLEESYSFVGTPKDAENRFIVKLNYQSGLDGSENSTFAYQSGNDIIVSGEGTLQIFDVMGRMIATQNINGVETVNVPANGVYVFRLNEKVQKVVVK